MRLAHVPIAARSTVRPALMTVSTALTVAANPQSAATARMSSSRSERVRACVHAVEQGSHGFGEIVPDRAFAPYAGLSRDDREQARRIHLGFRRMAPNPLQRGDRFAVGAPQFDLEDAHPGLQAHGTPFRSGRIPVRVDRDGAGLVGFHAPPVARVEPDAGQWKHVVLLRLEQFDHRNIMPVVIRSGDAFALVKPHARQRLEALGDGIGTIRLRLTKPTAFSTLPFPWPEYGSRNRGSNP